MFISIKINKNKIDTAPTYTNRYDKPINTIPTTIKYKDILANKDIKYKTDTIGFLAIIVNIADKKETTTIISKKPTKNPLNFSITIYKFHINNLLILIIWT